MKKNKPSEIIIFTLSSLLYLSIGYLLSFSFNYIYGDALSRTFHAYTVFFGNEPKLSAIGFVWPPLPTLLQFPLVLIPSLNINGFSGNIFSAIFMALSALYIYKILIYWKLPKKYNFILLLSYILNPMIIFYGANGMSEAIEIFFFTTISYYYIKYYDNPNVQYLIALSFLTAFGIMSRYEMLILIPFMSGIFFSYLFFKKRDDIKKTESTLIIYNFPIFFTLGFWLFANWAILGDPFYFITSNYSNSAQSQQNLPEAMQFHNFGQTIIYMIERTYQLYPAFLISIATLFILLQKKKKFFPFTLLLLTSSLLIFHLILLSSGQSFGWLRFFITIIPSAIILSAYIVKEFSSTVKLLFTILLVVYTYSSIQTVLTMTDERLGKEEYHIANSILYHDLTILKKSETVQEMNINKEIAEHIKEHAYQKKILVDDFTGFGIIYFSGDTSYFIETIDSNFEQTLKNIQIDDDVGYMLVTKPERIGKLDAINKEYPNLFENGADFVTLEKDFGKWKLYKLIK